MNRPASGDFREYRRNSAELLLSDPDYAILSELVPELERLAAAKPTTVLDFGAGNSPYRPLFKDSKYIAADIQQNQAGDIDLLIGKWPLPLKSDSVDLVLCIYVLEHLGNPSDALREFHRVLRPGGRLFVVTPFIYREHEAPNDFHRPTIFALREMLAFVGSTTVRKIGNPWFTLYSLANEMHIRSGEIIRPSWSGRVLRAAFNRLALPLLNLTLFRIAASEDHSVYHTAFATTTKMETGSGK